MNTSDTFIGNINPMRYKGYYYDKESKMYYCKSRYYVPQWCRWLNADHTAFLDVENINGMNLFSYCQNNPICILQRNQIMKLTGRQYDGIVINSDISTEPFITSEKTRQKAPLVNFVQMIHYSKSITDNILIGMAVGNITHTITTQFNNVGIIYAYSNIGNSTSSVGIGLNIKKWYGVSLYISSNIGIGSNVQITPYATIGVEISIFDGVSISFGRISGNITDETTVSIGWGTLAAAYVVCAGIAALPAPGTRVIAGLAACVIFLIDVFK